MALTENRDERVDESLKHSMRDGVFASLMSGFTQDYFTPFLLMLGGTVRHVGLLSALPNLTASLIQLKSADIAERFGSRRNIINIFVLLQALTLVPMVLVYLLGPMKIAAFIAVVTMFTSLGAIAHPAWASLMADLVEVDRRGEYFGWRNKVLGFIGVGATFAAGLILHRAGRFHLFLGFAAIFAVASVFRLLSWRYLTKMHEPAIEHKKEDYFSLFDFISRARYSNFARFVVFTSMMKFAVNVASPFFAVLMLKDLGFSYLSYTIVTVAATLATNLTIKRWGVHADRVGNLKVTVFTSRLIAVIPLLWLVNQNPVFLIVAQIFSGFAWAGFNLASSNFIYDACTPGKRTRCIAYFNAFNGLSLCLGALLGGLLAQRLPAGIFDYRIMNIILLSALLRLIVAFLMPFRLKEVRAVEKIRSHQLLLSMLKR